MKKTVLIAIIVILCCNTGCYSVRKKFVRKKKTKDSLPVYVNFKEYPEKPPKDIYINYYLFVRGWLDELVEALEKGISYKRSKKAADEAVSNFEQMFSFYNAEGKEKIYSLYENLLQIRETVIAAPRISQVKKNSLIREIKHFKREFEKGFSYIEAEKWMN